jgi:hypothetical protein
MAGTQFGGSGGGDDRFGYYSATVTTSAGSPGGPVGAFGAPHQPSQVESSTRSSGIWVALLVVIFLLIGAVVGGWWWKQHGKLVLPEQLGGMQRNTSSPDSRLLDSALAQAAERAGGRNKIAGALYGPDPKQATVLLVSRGPDVAAAQPSAAGPGVKAYGPDLCSSTPKLVTCVRARGDLSVVVMAARTGPGVPPAVVAGWADEAWAAQ